MGDFLPSFCRRRREGRSRGESTERVACGPCYPLIRLQALLTGRYPLLSLTQIVHHVKNLSYLCNILVNNLIIKGLFLNCGI
jgi:hypothetical protein